MCILSVCVALAVGQTPSLQPFNKTDLGVLFDYPKAWKLTAKKGTYRMEVPTPNGPATIDLFPANFKSDIDTWQAIEAAIAKQKKQEVTRQWQEELMGVPLLLTETRFATKGNPRAGLAGLVYAWTPRKLLFRIDAPESSFAETVAAWRTVMATLRTVDGKLPEVESTSKPWAEQDVARANSPVTKVTRFTGPTANKKEAVLAPIQTPVKVAGRDMVLHLPEGWSAKPKGDFVFELSNPDTQIVPSVTLLSTLDSDVPEKALFKASSASLDLFSSVSNRLETKASPNKALATMCQIWREGKTAEKERWSLEGYGSKDRFYWLMTAGGEGKLGSADRKALEALMDAMSLEPAP